MALKLEPIEFRSPIVTVKKSDIFDRAKGDDIPLLLDKVWQRRWATIWEFLGIVAQVSLGTGAFTDAPINPPVGTQFFVGDPYFHLVVWDGTQWQFADGGNGFISDFPIAPTAGGWQECDGTATTILTLGAVLTETPYVTKNLDGHYKKTVAAGADALVAAVAPVFTGTAHILTGSVTAPVFTGTPAVLTGTNSIPAFTGTAHVLTGTNSVPVFTGTPAVLTGTVGAIAATATTALTTLNAAGQNTADNLHTHPAPSLTMNSYTPAGTVSAPVITMDSYTPAGTINAPILTMDSYTPAGTNSVPVLTMNSYTPVGTIDASAEPAAYKVLSYIRR